MGYCYKIKTTFIDYSINYEDVDWLAPEDLKDEELDAWCDEKIEQIRQELPQELELEVTVDSADELDYMIADAISEETGWLVEVFTYSILETTESED